MRKQVRPHEDDMVDRPGVEVQQCMERTGTNRPRTYLTKIRESIREETYVFCSCQGTGSEDSVVMAVGVHLFPYRTQQLSLQTPKVLRGRPLGRIGSR